MLTTFFKYLFPTIIFCMASANVCAQIDSSEAHVRLTMRKIGHEILKSVGDYSSRVMPIEKQKERYKISFESEFLLNPDVMSDAIHPVVLKNRIASSYRVEVAICQSNTIVYGYEIGLSDSASQLACSGRLQPIDCYEVYFTILQKPKAFVPEDYISEEHTASAEAIRLKSILWPSIFAVFIALALVLIRKKRTQQSTADHILTLGKFQFDQRKMLLLFKNTRTELTSKESDLLALLLESANVTVEREAILSSVWGDDGDYIGRTLDVFISKLRKKLSADDSVKIINIRGVGYKLLVEN